MDSIVLQALKREVIGKKVKNLRKEGKLPAVIFGKDINSTPITLDLRETTHALKGVSSSNLIIIDLDGKKHTTLVRDKQYDVLRDTLQHIDFQAISMTETIRTMVPLQLVGEAPAISQFDAILQTETNEIEIEALPNDLPSVIHVDLSNLNDIGDSILVSDLEVGSKVTILQSPDTLIVTARPAVRVEEEEEEEEVGLEEMVSELEPEVIERGKREEEEEEE